MKKILYHAFMACTLGLALGLPSAQAGLFDDDQARRAIIELREKVAKLTEQLKAKDAESVTTQEQISQIKRSLLDLNTQLEAAQAESAKLRGQNEQLMQDVAELQRGGSPKAPDNQGSALTRAEGKTVRMDGKEFSATNEEQQQFDEALGVLRKGEFAKATAAFTNFQKRYPGSGYNESALFWLGNAHYAKGEYREALIPFRSLVTNAPNHQRAPEALLSVASCQKELRDIKGARSTLQELLKTYPKSEAALAARERLATLK